MSALLWFFWQDDEDPGGGGGDVSGTTTPTTFSDLYTDVLNRVRANTSDTASIQIAKRLINQGLHDVHIQKNWQWAEREATLLTHALYDTGTVAISTGARTTVTGTDTLWDTATGYGFDNARAGGKMTFEGSVEIYKVSTVTSDTAITLSNTWVGDALSGATYRYFEDEYALASDFFRLKNARVFGDVLMLPVRSRQEFRMKHPRNSHLGDPQECTIFDLAPSGSTATQPRIVFHPVPNTVMSIPYTYMTSNLAVSSAGVAQTQMSSDDDEPIIPLRYRHVLVLYAISHWYRDRKDDARSQEAGAEYVDLVARMAADLAPEFDKPRMSPTRRNRLGRPGPMGGRFTTGTRFDEMR